MADSNLPIAIPPEDDGKKKLPEFIGDAPSVNTNPALNPQQNQILRELLGEVKPEFSDEKILKSDWTIDISAYVASFVWIVVSTLFVYWFYKSVASFNPDVYQNLNSKAFYLLLIQKLGFTLIGLTLIVSLYKFSRYLFAQSIEYRYMYFGSKIKVAVFLATLRSNGSFSDSLIEKLVSQKLADHGDPKADTLSENVIEKLTSILKSAIDKVGGK